ncbi:hypothetical protein HZU83_06330 [Sphaerotilus montanus]|uniref:Uncharacterized protein n=1 Tax=Sphaerotilus montanus TaxID=522889 RepID=A0A7Y9UJ78_9BURK|nr:hypothetical protein [Sphaerotilus montanus]NYG32505.1 hypothetical protein [Sphaerotilus montanus]NZD56292.1 hypothetical protein [Sphaerotilus montanus]
MKIHDDHLYHGAALIQIAEHEKFTAINSLKIGRVVYKNAYRINDDIAVYFKYATNPTAAHGEYVFTFKSEHIDLLKDISENCKSICLALVCVKDREVCCITYSDFKELIALREKAKGAAEDQYAVLITAPSGKGMRAYVNAPGVRGQMIGDPIKVPRNSFPDAVFG